MITKITPDGISRSYGTINHFPGGMAVDDSGNVYITNPNDNTVTKITPDTTPPTITLNGDAEMTIYRGQSYYENGFVWNDNLDGYGYVYTANSGSIDTSTIGTYVLTYNYTDNAGNTSETLTRTVHVVADDVPPVFSIQYNRKVNVAQHKSYDPTPIESDFDCYDNIDGWCNDQVILSSGSVDTNTTGNYTLTYSVTDSNGNTAYAHRIVRVFADRVAPVMKLYGASEVSIYRGIPYIGNALACWTDNVDGDGEYAYGYGSGDWENTDLFPEYYEDPWIPENSYWYITGDDRNGDFFYHQFGGECTTEAITGSVDTDTLGDYTLTYSYTDQAGNISNIVTRTVHVIEDTEAPVVTLNGNSTITIPTLGTPYNEQGASAYDHIIYYDEEVEINPITISGSVDTNTAGTYTVTYTATDANGNVGSATRTVIVGSPDTTAPILTLHGDNPQIVYQWGYYYEL